MRIESSVTSLSWVPLGAVEGFNRLSFGLRVAHYDPPPPDVLGDLDELAATDRFRFANQLKAWIEVEDGRVVDAGQSGSGRINVTKVGYGPASIAFTPIALPDLQPDPDVGPSWARFVQTTGGQTGFPTRGVRKCVPAAHAAFNRQVPRTCEGSVALTVTAPKQRSYRHENLPLSSGCPAVGLRGLPLPARRHRAGRPLVPALRPVLP
jgi:hypothetical protein